MLWIEQYSAAVHRGAAAERSMASPRVERRLAAILAADIVGYSRLVEQDEAGTLAAISELRQRVIDPLLAEHQGRIVKLMGDGAIIEFGSVVNAVACAVAVQKALAHGQDNTPADRLIVFRMGVNLGDVVVDGDDLIGDGVNVAARLEQMCEPGGLMISGTAHEHLAGKLDCDLEPLGERPLKNIARPIRVYRALIHKKATAPFAPPPTPDRPSIAVLPFMNMSTVRDQDFFADGMTEDLITALSRVRELFVISRTSSFAYKERTMRLEEVARELGVRFLLEGSVRVAGGKVRVTAQLIDGMTGGHLWAERFDGDLEDIFGVQDRITRNIVLALQIKLTYGELARLWEGNTQNLQAWEKMVLARDLFLKFNRADNRRAQSLLEEALMIDSNYTGAMVQLGLSHWIDARFGFSSDKECSLRHAEKQVETALGLNPELGSAYMLKGGIAFLRDQHEDAVGLCQRAADLAPGDSWVQAFLGLVCIYAGEARRAVEALIAAMRLSPHYPSWYTYNLALAQLWAGDLHSAQEAAELYLRQEPDEPYAYTNLATVYGFQGRGEDAARVVSSLRKRFAAVRIDQITLSQRYREREKLERVVGILRQAGLPD
jgi:TolB-like protein/Tfp pilus assembly protein PilF